MIILRVRLLGTAAGGGYPQWNTPVGPGEAEGSARTEACVAVSHEGSRWFLIGASLDIRAQILSFPKLRPVGKARGTAIEAVLLAGADLDHSHGIYRLREGDRLKVHATSAVRRSLSEGHNLDSTMGSYCGLDWSEPPRHLAALPLADGRPSGLEYAAFPVPGKPPRYREAIAGPDPGDSVGYAIEDASTSRRLVVLPGLARFDGEVLRHLDGCSALLVDGAFWKEREMAESGASDVPASAMGHLPIGGSGGSLERVGRLGIPRVIYFHINNTNPILIDGSPERREVEAAGVEVGFDGMEFEV